VPRRASGYAKLGSVHWDDLHVLQMIDLLEEAEPGALVNGLGLMQRVASGQQLDHNRDYAPFVWELMLASRAGYVTRDGRGIYSQSADARANPNS
jgi:hypothetical protein